MFTLDQIKAAHSKVKSGADFPDYIQELIALGVTGYETHVADGHTDYFGGNGFTVSSEPKYATLEIAAASDAEQFRQRLKAHQRGETNYPTFCADCAKTGVQKWIVDMEKMTCTYYDIPGRTMLTEAIPVP